MAKQKSTGVTERIGNLLKEVYSHCYSQTGGTLPKTALLKKCNIPSGLNIYSVLEDLSIITRTATGGYTMQKIEHKFGKQMYFFETAKVVHETCLERKKTGSVRKRISTPTTQTEDPFSPENGSALLITKEGDQYKTEVLPHKEVVVVMGEEKDPTIDDEVIHLKMNKKSARVLLLILEENNDEIYKKFTEKISNQLFELIF